MPRHSVRELIAGQKGRDQRADPSISVRKKFRDLRRGLHEIPEAGGKRQDLLRIIAQKLRGGLVRNFADCYSRRVLGPYGCRS